MATPNKEFFEKLLNDPKTSIQDQAMATVTLALLQYNERLNALEQAVEELQKRKENE